MHFDFIVIGAGIAGASVAYQLSAHGRVAVLERESQPGYHSTGRSAALFMETYGTPSIRALTRASRDFFTATPVGFSDSPILSPRGAMHVGKRGQEALLSEFFSQSLSTSARVQLLTTSEVLERCPVLRSEEICGAVYDQGAMDMDVHALHQGYLRGLRARSGVVWNEGELSSASIINGRWEILLADKRTLAGNILINAAGAWADNVAACCGVQPLGIQPKRRTAFTFPAPDSVDFDDWPMVIGLDESYYFKPDAGQLLGSPANADPADPQDIQPEELDVAMGIYSIEEITTLKIRRLSHVWAGLRSFAPDGDFVIGADPANARFFWLAGQGGYGIQTASSASELAASLILQQQLPEHLASQGLHSKTFHPARLRR